VLLAAFSELALKLFNWVDACSAPDVVIFMARDAISMASPISFS
jgi:hypothetical protein